MAEIDTKTARAENLVKKYMLGAVAAGLVPVPLFNLAALIGLQLIMLHSLATLYGVEFSSQLGKAVLASLLGGALPASLSYNVVRFVKGMPGFGLATGIISMALFGGASTYAIGKVFINHFESGNTLLTFDPQQVRDYYAQQFARGKEEVRMSFVGIKP